MPSRREFLVTAAQAGVAGALIATVFVGCKGDVGPGLPAEFLPLASISAGALHSCGGTPAGAPVCWGSNAFLQLGDSMQADTTRPVPVWGGLIVSVLSAGEFHTCVLTSAGAPYCWGEGTNGKLGDGRGSSSIVPVAVSGGLVFAMISAGNGHTCGVTVSGAAYCWGNNYDGQLGDSTSSGPELCYQNACSTIPVAVSGGLAFLSVSAGESHTCGVTTAHVGYCWGTNGAGELGVGDSIVRSTTPVPVSGGLSIATISAGTLHTCAVTTAGKAYCWGDNAFGQLGDGTTTRTLAPVPVSGGLTFSTVSASGGHTCALTPAGAAFCWGYNNGRFGNGTTANSSTPVRVGGGLSFTSVSAGHNSPHVCGLTRDHVGYCWGGNLYGQLGDGTTVNSYVPVVVKP